MKKIIIYLIILFISGCNILGVVKAVDLNNTFGKVIIKPSTLIISALLSLWLIIKLLELLKNKKEETNEITSLSSTPDTIIINTPSTKPSWIKQSINFLTFDTPTYRSVFDEGQRRLMIVVSILAPFLISYIWFYDFEDGYLPSDWPVASPIFYIMFHVIILIYIWIKEGSGNVRAGGNAGKSLWNLVKVGLISFLIVAAMGISFEKYNKIQKEKRIEEDKVVVLEKTERLISCIPTESIDCITELVVYHKKNEISTGYLKSFSDCDFNNVSLLNAYVERSRSYPFHYELSGKIEYNIRCSKNKKFKQVVNNIKVEYNTNLEIIDIKIGD